MDAVGVNGGKEKVYGFDEKVYRKSNRKSLISSGVFELFLTAMFAAIFYSQYKLSGFRPIYLLFLIGVTVPIVRFAWTLSKYFRAKNFYGTDSITIRTSNGVIKSVEVYFREDLCGIFYRIRSVDELKRKKYIDVKGNIEKEYVYDQDISLREQRRLYRNDKIDGTEMKENLRIPACFENMDEIYAALEKMKGQG